MMQWHELQQQERITLNIDTNTSASFTNQPSTSSGFIGPVSVVLYRL